MLTLSWAQLRALIQAELDLEEETFVDDTDLMSMANKAIDEAEQHIMSIYQDYYRTKYSVPLVNGTSEYVMPSDIYANKIRLLFYANGTTKYKVPRIKMTSVPFLTGNEDYQYDIEHKAAATGDPGIRMVLYPASRETSSTSLTMWYIRNANRVVDDNSPIDIPEAHNFIRAYVARELAKKELGLYLLPPESGPEIELAKQAALLKQTLDAMVPDEDETIEPDMSFYEEFNMNYGGG